MQTNLENVDKHRVRLSVDVSAAEARPILDLAYRHLAGSINVPGFRKGKAPRKIVEAQVGRDTILREFLEHALPEFYARALRDHDLAPIDDPEFDDLDVGDVEGSGLRFTATVDVRPRLSFEDADYKGLTITRPPVEVSEREVDEQLDRLRDRFAELEVVGRPAARGDFVLADIRGYVHEQEIPEASGQDVMYEVGSEALVPELDRELEGKRRGDILKLNATLPERFGDRAGQELSFSVIVKDVKAKRLPPLDDDFARTASEFDSLEELRNDIREKVRTLKGVQADAAVRDLALQALIEKVDVELPERLLDHETERRVESARARAEQQGTTLEAVLRQSDVDELRFRSDARAHATRAVKADLALEAVARAEQLAISDQELNGAVEAIARDVGRSAKDVRRTLERSGQITSLAGDIIREKALGVVVEHAEVVDEGNPTPSEGTD
ncbi:MAG TPA: trigger factor [Actinomycetota bacterium]|nr:trigger factor [Actinomycetota bacterium]